MDPEMIAAEVPESELVDTPDNGPMQPLVDHCLDMLALYEKSEYRKAKIAEIEEGRKVYEQTSEDTDFPWEGASNITLPLTAITVDNLEPRLVAGLVGKEPAVRFVMDGQEKQDEPTQMLETWFNRELKEKVGIEQVTMGQVHTMLLEGTWYGVPKYDLQEVTRRDFLYQPQTGQIITHPASGKPLYNDRKETLFEGGQIEHVAFTDVLIPDDVGSPEEWEKTDKILIRRPTYGDLMRRKDLKGYINIGPWLIANKTGKELSEADQSPTQKNAGVKVTGREVIKCAEFHITYAVNRNLDEDEDKQRDFTEDRYVVTIALDSKMLIRLVELKDINFRNESIIKRMRLFPEAGRSYGTSLYGKMKSIQAGADDIFNALINISYVCMLPYYFYEEGSGVKGEIKIVPGEGVPVDSVKGILFPNFNINPSSYISFFELFVQLWQRMGVSDWDIGTTNQQGGKKTATEVMSVLQEGNIRHDYQSRTMKEECISVLKTLYDLYYQHMPFNYTWNYNGQKVPIPRQLMRRNYRFTLSGSTATANKMIERKESEDLLMMLGQNPLVNPITPLQDVLKSYGKVNVDEYINPQINQLVQAFFANPEIGQVVQQYLQNKMMLAQTIEQGAKEKGGAVNAGLAQ